MTHAPGHWSLNIEDGRAEVCVDGERLTDPYIGDENARLIAAAPELLDAAPLHQAWSDSESSGPDYGGQSRDTHPDGERIWRSWWNNQLDLCDRATRATAAAIAKAEGRS